MAKQVSDVNENTFEQNVLESDLPVLVDFWAPWCVPCLLLAPIVEAVAEKYADRARVVTLNVDQNQSISERYGVKGIPTLILFKGGAEEERVVGATTEQAISRIIERCAGTARP